MFRYLFSDVLMMLEYVLCMFYGYAGDVCVCFRRDVNESSMRFQNMVAQETKMAPTEFPICSFPMVARALGPILKEVRIGCRPAPLVFMILARDARFASRPETV